MKLNIKTILQSAMAVTVLSAAVWAAAPTTEQVTAPLALTQTKANTSLTINGQWWSPRNAANWPAVYVDFTTGSQSLGNSGQVAFFSHVNGSIKANAGYEIRTVAADISAVSASNWSTATPVTSLGSGTWYDYDLSTNANEAIQPLTVLVGNSSGALYAVKLNNFSNVGQQTVAGQLQVKADANIEYKAL
ncbi:MULTISPECIES: hypothetical protein [Sphingobacterium]|uniref:DUF4082 domain-containing protein n=1 Tax=Sphingobacterium kitahiroshimense TaxID=470446 RepID=A0ABV0BUX4_9SPHI|nr:MULTISPECIES: hypothetical protein [Sphingobacterium]MBB2953480.1 hypothetical protein [Sphingobacterium sp. JUb56]MCS3554947.1 hypothetical protein [Sphingobacterium sp. JUb21]MCW2262875.1 hypothetical protein [Sphingobacterium kitahiroshimense]NJI73822.1 hypothetical protein [Sphingobacterium sp. B16(2022)]TCR05656.1 hypothetical protein EDF66_106124 [Sphingobacterium sp. JUb20]